MNDYCFESFLSYYVHQVDKRRGSYMRKNDLSHLFHVGQNVIYQNTDFDVLRGQRNEKCVVKEVYPDHIIINRLYDDVNIWCEEGFNIGNVFPS